MLITYVCHNIWLKFAEREPDKEPDSEPRFSYLIYQYPIKIWLSGTYVIAFWRRACYDKWYFFPEFLRSYYIILGNAYKQWIGKWLTIQTGDLLWIGAKIDTSHTSK